MKITFFLSGALPLAAAFAPNKRPIMLSNPAIKMMKTKLDAGK